VHISERNQNALFFINKSTFTNLKKFWQKKSLFMAIVSHLFCDVNNTELIHVCWVFITQRNTAIQTGC
jgi:hypothetical protein